jgi:hypothetical protein
MRDWEDQPEAAGPGSESNFGTAEKYDEIKHPAIPAADPSAEAILRNLEAEARADAGKTVPADALEVTS